MIAFKKINQLIEDNKNNPEKDIYLGHFYGVTTDEENAELATWYTEDNDTFEKTIAGKKFSFRLDQSDFNPET